MTMPHVYPRHRQNTYSIAACIYSIASPSITPMRTSSEGLAVSTNPLPEPPLPWNIAKTWGAVIIFSEKVR